MNNSNYFAQFQVPPKRIPLREQVQFCMVQWAAEAREDAINGDVEGFEGYVEMVMARYGAKETAEEALPWMQKVYEEKFKVLKIRHSEQTLCDSQACSRCRAKRRLDRLIQAAKKK